MSKKENTHKMTIRLSPLTEFRLERDYRLDGSRSKNEFIERAITHYQDLLEAKQNETLPAAIQSAIGGRLLRTEEYGPGLSDRKESTANRGRAASRKSTTIYGRGGIRPKSMGSVWPGTSTPQPRRSAKKSWLN